MDDLHDLLARGDRLDHLVAQRPLLHPAQEVLRDPEVDVRLEQHAANLPETVTDHRLRQDPALAERPQGSVQFPAQLLEHRPPARIVGSLPGAHPRADQ